MTATPPQTPSSDRAWAGRVVFPRSSAELRSTTICPACMVPLTSTVCASCGLDLRHEASAELARASAAAADAVDARLDIIGRIRRETATAAVSAPAVPTAAGSPPLTPAPLEARSAATAPVAAPGTAPTVSAATAAPPAVAGDGPRRSGIQIALTIVGVSLLSVFAIFALVFAFVTYGNDVRMAIIVGGTLLTMIAAGALKRRRLDATGEGIAVLGTVMLVLTAWALRVGSPIGLDRVPESLYWGVALLLVGAICAVWSRLNHLSTPAVVSAALLPIGAALLTAHGADELLPLTGGASTTAGALAALITASASWLVVRTDHPSTRRAARIVAQSIGAVAASIALVSLGTLDDDARWAPLIGGLVLAASASLHLVTSSREFARPRRALDTLTLAAIGGGAVVAAMAGAVLTALRIDQDRVVVSAPVLAAVAIAVVAEQAWRRSSVGSAARTALASATLVATAHAAIAGGLAAVVGASAFAEAATRSLRSLPLGVGGTVAAPEPATIAALGALALSLGLIAASWAVIGVLVHRSRVVTLIGAILMVASVPLLGAWWLVMLAFGLLAVAASVALHVAPRIVSPDAQRALFAFCIPLATGAALGAFLTGWAVPRGGVVGLIIAVLAIAIARPTTNVVPLRAAAVALATVLVIGSAPSVANDTIVVGLPEVSAAAALMLTAAIIIVLTQVGRLSTPERWAGGGVALSIALVVALVVGTEVLPGTEITARIDAVTAHAALAVALTVVAFRRRGGERSIARAALPLVVAVGTLAAIAPLALESTLSAVIAIGALTVVTALGLVPQPDEPTVARGLDRISSDIVAGGLGVLLVAAGFVASSTGDHAWATVLALAVLALVTAISRDGLIGSRSPRRFIGWLALALATLALWFALVDGGVDEPEAYSLPLAGAVLLIAGANAVVARRSHSHGDRTAAPLTAVALLIALIPTALASVDEPAARYIVVAAVGTLLAIVPLLRAASIDARLPQMASAVVSTGFTALGVLTITHTLDLVFDSPSLTGVDLVRAVVLVALPAAAAVAAWILATGRLRAAVTAAGTGVAALSAGMLGLGATIEPVELVSLPLAVSLLAIGAVRLDERPASRSWAWLAPGVGTLLVPSLLAIDGAGEPLWRAVALGIAAAAVFVLALRLRLQAPFVIGGVVLLVHLLVQSWPLLETVGESVEWWIWLGLAGVAVVALAARYERRLQNVRDTAVRISQLR